MISVVPSRSTKNGLEIATAEYGRQLSGSPGESLLLERGITKETQAAFRLGYVESPLTGDESYQGYITIPYLTVSGVTTMRFRKTEGDGPKYLSFPGDIGRPYNVGSLYGAGPIFVTEGELDAVVGHQCGLLTVGFPGAQSWTHKVDGRSIGRVFSRLFRFREVFVLADGDEAGKMFAETVRKDVEGAKVIEMHPGGDVNSMFLEHGEQYLREWVGLDE